MPEEPGLGRLSPHVVLCEGIAGDELFDSVVINLRGS